jgi:hypothetical protein
MQLNPELHVLYKKWNAIDAARIPNTLTRAFT